ncbi:acylneuraminate cytidylyltransferase family protein [Oribacterium sp. P6A1]|uniref:acylneuraminate cytidylyltransferase family protein n=1 Tax=Oribacterium sp. P6A1 TaxID=1410612 RepID=UPI0005685240|nr:acylneuraminate cytidylyltransferase family protein [Oribacterium sp. P6A1]
MFADKKILALIPARGGSKGIKNKNIVDLCGKPLIAHTIASAKKSSYIDRVIISTDSVDIARVSKDYGAEVPFMRPDELASDIARTVDVVMHAVKYFLDIGDLFDVLILLQPTQPLRTETDIDGAIELFFEKGEKGLVSVSPVDDNPILIRTIGDNGELKGILEMNSTCRRQDMPSYYKVNGCIYINRVEDLTRQTSFNDNPIGYVMESSHSVDIDEPKDLVMAEFFLRKGKENGVQENSS